MEWLKCLDLKKKANELGEVLAIFLFGIVLFSLMFLSFASAADPNGLDSVNMYANETRGNNSAGMVNLSGGYISTINISATVQNTRWKAFVGYVSGSFTLDDSTGSSIYDWRITTIGGEVYASRNSSTILWTNVTCAPNNTLEAENNALSHTSPDDNISKTFNDTTHDEFFVASVNISYSSCRTLNTYVNNATQDTRFEEVALYESRGSNIIYATILESRQQGFDSSNYDFQMIVPENGAQGFLGATAYYLYVELS